MGPRKKNENLRLPHPSFAFFAKEGGDFDFLKGFRKNAAEEFRPAEGSPHMQAPNSSTPVREN
jgi:hypothetical protein